MSVESELYLARQRKKLQNIGLEPVDDVALAMAPRAPAAPVAPPPPPPAPMADPMAARPAYKPLGIVGDPNNPLRYSVPEGYVDPMGKPVPSTPLNFAPRADGKIGFYDREERARENRRRDLADPSLRVVNPMSGTTEQGGKWAAWGTMAPPEPGLPAPDAVRTAMTGPGRPPPQPAMENPMARAPGPAAAEAADPMKAVPMRDRLTMLMWRNSRDTQGIRKFNEAARRNGLPLQDVPKTMDERRREAGGIPAWAPDGRGGIYNPSTGETRPVNEAPEPIDWNKRMVQQADGTWVDMETQQVVGKPKEEEHDWQVLPDGRRVDRKSKTGEVAGTPAPLRGADRYLKLSDDRYFDAEEAKYVKGDGTPDDRKDKYQGRVVKITTGPDSYQVGVYDKAKGVYSWKSNVKNGTTMTNSDGTSLTFGGEGGLDLSMVKEFVDPDMPAAKAEQTAAAAKPTDSAPIGTIGTVKGKRMKKVAEGKWEPV